MGKIAFIFNLACFHYLNGYKRCRRRIFWNDIEIKYNSKKLKNSQQASIKNYRLKNKSALESIDWLIEKYANEQLRKASKTEKPKKTIRFYNEPITPNSVIEELFIKKSNINKTSIYMSFIYLILSYILGLFVEQAPNYFIYLLPNIIIWFIVLHQTLLNYRIKNGYFGMNYGEAKELLYYIMRSKNNNTHKGKKVFNDVKQQVTEPSKHGLTEVFSE